MDPIDTPDVDERRPTPEEAKADNPDETVDAAELPVDVPDGDASAGDETDDDGTTTDEPAP